MKTFLCPLVIFFFALKVNGKTFSNEDSLYSKAFYEISRMLEGEENLSFKKAVFITENAFEKGRLSYNSFNSSIKYLSDLGRKWIQANPNNSYKYSDSNNLYKNIAIFKAIKDTIKILEKNILLNTLPYSYDFDDYMGDKEWSDVFVTTLLKTHKGNCHSLPYLYKILADEIGAICWISFAPFHIYIKNRCEGTGWYNTELTSGQFPVDAWIMASGYVSPDAIRSGIYMDTLSNQQAVANCVLDLAKGYERKFKTYTDSFIIKCCDLTLKYHPTNINAIIYKAEILKKMYMIYKSENPKLASTVYPDMEKLYVQALDLGYKEMPEKMYNKWLSAISNQKEKYSNKKLQATIPWRK